MAKGSAVAPIQVVNEIGLSLILSQVKNLVTNQVRNRFKNLD